MSGTERSVAHPASGWQRLLMALSWLVLGWAVTVFPILGKRCPMPRWINWASSRKTGGMVTVVRWRWPPLTRRAPAQ